MLNIAHTVKIVLFRILIMKLITYFYTILVSSFENLHFYTEMCGDYGERKNVVKECFTILAYQN